MGLDVMNGIAITLVAGACLLLFARIGARRRSRDEGRDAERRDDGRA